MPRLRVLVLCDYFLPGFRAGGVLRSIANMLAYLGDEYDFRLITRARDYTTTEPYPGIETRTWLPVEAARVQYLGEGELRPWIMQRALRDADCDVLMLNSVLSPHFAITPLVLRWLRLIPDVPFIVSPNGELAETALAIKSTKKRVYLAVAKLLGLYTGVTWRASDEREAADVRRCFGDSADAVVASNLPTPPPDADPGAGRRKESGALKLVFLSRLARIKNLAGVLEALQGVRGSVQFDLYGPKDDPEHWEKCEQLISELPANVKVAYGGPVPSDQIFETLGRYDFFVLRTEGESFGYVIAEALCAGCPVVISDRTPWRGLEQEGVGWDLADDTSAFRHALQECVDMDEERHADMRRRARSYGREKARPTRELEKYRALLRPAGAT